MKRREPGLAMVEAAGALVVLLPAIVTFVALADLISRRGYIQEFTSEALNNFPVKPYALNTGVVSYFLQPRFSTLSRARDSDTAFQAEVDGYLDELELRFVRDQFCGGQSCSPGQFAQHYVIEALLVAVPINTATGIADTGYWTPQQAEQRASHVRRRGNFLPQWQDGDVVRLGLRHQIIDRAVEIVNASVLNARPFPFALPTALRGSTTQQYYGAWSFPNGPSDFGRDYFRSAFLVGFGVALNLESNRKAQLLRRAFGTERFVASIEVSGTRNAL